MKDLYLNSKQKKNVINFERIIYDEKKIKINNLLYQLFIHIITFFLLCYHLFISQYCCKPRNLISSFIENS